MLSLRTLYTAYSEETHSGVLETSRPILGRPAFTRIKEREE